MRVRKMITTLKFIGLTVFILITNTACSYPESKSCKNLIEGANNTLLMNETWEELKKFFEEPLEYDYTMGPDSILFFKEEVNGYRRFGLDWEEIGIIHTRREIRYNYKEEYKYQNLNEDSFIYPYMINSIYVGGYPHRLLFTLKNADEKSSKQTLGYDLSVECNNRVSGTKVTEITFKESESIEN